MTARLRLLPLLRSRSPPAGGKPALPIPADGGHLILSLALRSSIGFCGPW
jgi:hypothetical protein